MNIYKSKTVEALELFYGNLLQQHEQFPSITAHLKAIADRMWEGVSAKNPFVYTEISNYHPHFLGKSIETLCNTPLTPEDCNTTIAHEYGFKHWTHLSTSLGNATYDLQFEQAIHHLVTGNFDALKQQLRNDPSLVKKRSKYGHEATLLHYTASNGVELWRQKVPLHLPELTAYLLAAGANARATMNVYGGHYNTLALLKSSAHPFEAGIGEAMVRILENHY